MTRRWQARLNFGTLMTIKHTIRITLASARHALIVVLTLLLAGGITSAATSGQVESIIRGIATPRDTPIPFIERRTNRLLAEPLKLNGYILFATDGTLTKQIGEPFNERIIISARHVELQRKGKTRRLSLDRRPDIKAFYIGMQALLSGDLSTLLDSFKVAATRDTSGWSLDLVPKKEKLRKFVARLRISGKSTQVLTVRIEQPDGYWQEMSFSAN